MISIEFYDNTAGIRKILLFYYPSEEAIKVYETYYLRIILKFIKIPNVSFQDLYKGNEINIYFHLHKIVDYGDDFTKKNILKKTRP